MSLGFLQLRSSVVVVAISLAGLFAGSLAPAQQPPSPTPLPPTPPSAAPVGASPIDYVRRVFAMSPADREMELAKKSPQARQVVEERLREFDRLEPQEVEARLQTLELRWYLLPLMRLASPQRSERLAAIPEKNRALVVERLREWDKLTPEEQSSLLANETLIQIIFRSPTSLPSKSPSIVSKDQQNEIERRLRDWNALPGAKQQEILERFKRFFELTDKERAKETVKLNSLTETERKQMEVTLKMFEQLPAAQRERCLNGFKQFAGLSPSEREEFLRNATRWQAMSAKDRQVWRALVTKLAPKPPNPPGLILPGSSPPMPPSPPGGPRTVVVTNTNR